MRSRKNNAASVILLLMGMIFFIVGVMFNAAGALLLINHDKFMDNAESTEAEIVRIELDRYKKNGKTRTTHDVWVQYEVSGQAYEEELGYYKTGMNVGDIVVVYYDPEHPSDIRSDSRILEVVFLTIGVFFGGIGVIFFIINASLRSRRKKLMETGDRLTGTITDITRNYAVRINGRNPFKAECEVIDPYSGEKYLYSSENVTDNISELLGREVTVYVDRDNKRNYYVDIFELMDKYKDEENIHDYR